MPDTPTTPAEKLRNDAADAVGQTICGQIGLPLLDYEITDAVFGVVADRIEVHALTFANTAALNTTGGHVELAAQQRAAADALTALLSELRPARPSPIGDQPT